MCIAFDVVPKETDLGLSEYFPLNEDAATWASKIVAMINSKERYSLKNDLLNRYSAENIQAEYKTLYFNLMEDLENENQETYS